MSLTILAVALCGCQRGGSETLPFSSPLTTSRPAAVGQTRTPSPSSSGTSTPTPTPSPTPTLTPTPTPTPTPAPAEMLSNAEQALHDGDYETAAETYVALLRRSLDNETRARSLLGMGTAHLRGEAASEAVGAFRDLLTEHPASDQAHDATFLLADALVAAGEPLSATQYYSSYLQAGTVITPYVSLSWGDALRAAGVYTDAVASYQRAIRLSPNRTFEADAREKLALTHMAREEYVAAVAQYDAILGIARQPAYRAYIEHQAAETLLLAGNVEGGYGRHTNVVQTYPTQEHAYLSLVKLVEAGRPVNDLLRGRVDYYGGAYGPAVAALYRYIRAYPATHSGDAHWYAGLSFLASGSVELAINEFQLLIDTHPGERRWGDAWLKLAEVRADQGQTDQAVSTYRAFVEAAPYHPLAPEALWEAAQLLERAGRTETASGSYIDCQGAYPDADVAPAALFRGGLGFYQLGDLTEAVTAWTTLADEYPESSYRPAALLWLGKLHLKEGETEAADSALEAAIRAAPEEYYGLRARQIMSDTEAWPPPSPDYARQSGLDDQDEAEAWLADWLGLETQEAKGELSSHLAADGRLQRGLELWRLGRFQQAKEELEALRVDTYSEPLHQYQLALAYDDLGLYRSSILCAWRLINLSPVTRTVDAPRFVLRLAYPTHYEHLVLENARRTGLDPHLIFSLIRQESLFESLATSSASAQGLMQVIPPTGAEIAADLGWPPDYETADLYRPYVSLRFGTYYLAKQRDRFEGRIDAALAGYNGGPFNAQRWLERAGDDPDRFLEEITFSETRLYLQRIQEHLTVYQELYGE